jgi:hypothetical protein
MLVFDKRHGLIGIHAFSQRMFNFWAVVNPLNFWYAKEAVVSSVPTGFRSESNKAMS